MANTFTKVSPALWRSKSFQGLDADAKLLHLYLITNEHQNSSGSYRIPDGYACTDLGWDIERYLDARGALIDADLIAFDEEESEVYIKRWFKHCPPMNEKHAQGTMRMISGIESDRVRECAETEFEPEWQGFLDRVKSRAPVPIQDSRLIESLNRNRRQ
jgi:hypothetical protein